MTYGEKGKDFRELYNKKEQEKKELEAKILKSKRSIVANELALANISSSTAPNFEKRQAKAVVRRNIKVAKELLEALQSQLDNFDRNWLDSNVSDTEIKQ
jgi:hypothetical protein